jgi:hypothetical protein
VRVTIVTVTMVAGKGAYYKEKYGGGRSRGGGRGGGKGDGEGDADHGGSYGGGYGGGYGGSYGGSYGGGKCGGKGGGKGSGRGKGGGYGTVESTAGIMEPSATPPTLPVRLSADLFDTLRRIDGRPYGAYHDLEGAAYDMGRFQLVVQHAQSDPFAPPTRCYVSVPLASAGFPAHCFANKVREIAFRDYITRRFAAAARHLGADQRTEDGGWHGQKGGELQIDLPGQHVLERSSVVTASATQPLLPGKILMPLQ